MPKEVFYKNLPLSTEMKNKFVSDIKRIVWQYKLAPATLKIEKGENVVEILVLSVELKHKNFDTKILELISRQNAHKIIYILHFENTAALALYMRKIYISEWLPQNEITLDIKGLNFDKVWDNFVAKIAITEPISIDASVAELLIRQEGKVKIQREIAAIENKIKNGKQFNQQVKLKQELKKLKEKRDL